MTDSSKTPVGFLGLAGLLDDCLEHFQIILLDPHSSGECKIVCRDFRAQEARLLVWGLSTGILGEQDYQTDLDQPHVYPAVHDLLTSIKFFFEIKDDLIRKYGLKSTSATLESLLLSSPSSDAEEGPLLCEQQDQSGTSINMQPRCIVSNLVKFRQLVEDLRDSIDALQDLVASSEVLTRQCNIIREQINHAEIQGDSEVVAILREASTEIQVLRIQDEEINAHRGHSTTMTASEATEQAAGMLALTFRENSYKESDVSPLLPHSRSVGEGRIEYSLQEQTMPSPSDPISLYISGEIETQVKTIRYNEFTYGQVISPDMLASLARKWTQVIAEDREQILNALETPSKIKRLVGGGCGVTSRESGGFQSTASSRRLQKELQCWAKEPRASFISISPIDNNIFDLLGVIRGPPDTPFHGGIFFVRMYIATEGANPYPNKPIICQFLTKVYHPNIDENGRLYGFLESDWTPIFDLTSVLLTLSALLSTPAPEDAIREIVGAQYTHDRDRYNQIAAAYTTLYATGERPEITPISPEYSWWDYAQTGLERDLPAKGKENSRSTLAESWEEIDWNHPAPSESPTEIDWSHPTPSASFNRTPPIPSESPSDKETPITILR